MEWYKSLSPKFSHPESDTRLYLLPCINGIYFSDLPEDIFYLIVLHLDYEDIKIFYQVSKSLSPLNDNFWINKIYHDFGITEVSTMGKDLRSRYIQISIHHNILIAGGEKYVSSYRNAVLLAYQAAKKGECVSGWLATVDHLIVDNIQSDINFLVMNIGQIIYQMKHGIYRPSGYLETYLNAASIIIGKPPIFSYSNINEVYNSYNIAAAITGNLQLYTGHSLNPSLIYCLAILFNNLSSVSHIEKGISSDVKNYLNEICELGK